jgi:hypothetical protein
MDLELNNEGNTENPQNDVQGSEEHEGEDEGEDEEETIKKDSVLFKYFEAVQSELRSQDYPTVYKNGTFWIEPTNPFFALRKNRGSVIDLYKPRIFLWKPHDLLPGKLSDLGCPTCNSRLKTNGYDKDPHARRVVDLHG